MSSPTIMATEHTTIVLLHSSVAGICKKNVFRAKVSDISGAFSSDNCDPLTCQVTKPILLQLKVAIDPRVTLTDVGVLTNSGMTVQEKRNNSMEYNHLNLNSSKENPCN